MNLFDDDDEYDYERWNSSNPVLNNFNIKQYNYAIEIRNLSLTNENELKNIINLFKELIGDQEIEKNLILFNIVRIVTKFYINLENNDFVNLFRNNEKLGIINQPSFVKLITKHRKALNENYSLTDGTNYLDILAQELTKDFLLSNRMDMRKKSIKRSLDDYRNATTPIVTPIVTSIVTPTPTEEAAADGKRRKSRRKHSKKHSDGKRRRKHSKKHSKKHSDGKRKSRRKHSKKHSDGKRRKSLKKHRN
jgi:hypothetical protein